MPCLLYDDHGLRTPGSLPKPSLDVHDEEYPPDEMAARIEYNSKISLLGVSSETLRDALDLMRFAMCCLDFISGHPSGSLSDLRGFTQSTSWPTRPSARSQKAVLEEMEMVAEGLWKCISGINLRLISIGTANLPTLLDSWDHGVFFRVFSDTTDSPHSVSAGMRCSGWRNHPSRSPEVTRQHVLDHMNATPKPSLFISMRQSSQISKRWAR